MTPPSGAQLGVRANAGQLGLLVAATLFIGAMVGLERAVLPILGKEEFGLASRTAVLSFIAGFGIAKAFANLGAGAAAQRFGRRRLLVAGWALALPVPVLIWLAPSWGFVVAANVLLGVNQGLAWSMTMIMSLDLAGPRRRGLVLGWNEFAGYGGGVAIAAAASGVLAGEVGAREVLGAGGLAVAGIAFVATLLLVRDTTAHVTAEETGPLAEAAAAPPLRAALAQTALRDPGRRSASHAGFATKVVDGLAWGLAPLFLAAHGATVAEVGLLAAIYPAVWGAGQLATGAWSDRVGRKPLIVAGMLVQAAALGLLVASGGEIAPAIGAAILLGAGVALVYPTLPAAVSDAATASGRAASIGCYRFVRDLGYAAGALVAGLVADLLGFEAAIGVVAALAAAAAGWVATDMTGRPPARPRLEPAEAGAPAA